MKPFTGIVALLILLSPVALAVSAESEMEVNVNLCMFPLSPSHVKGHATFSIIAAFKVDPAGKVQNIEVNDNPFVSASLVRECISQWRIKGPKPGVKIAAMWRWKHAVGWEFLLLSWPGYTQKIVISGDHCYYCSGAGAS